ncbi:hypothetical protein L6R52_39230 [Myxococcota bacterium]|nr:hypothetical protein [Myxococcota bacterium]
MSGPRRAVLACALGVALGVAPSPGAGADPGALGTKSPKVTKGDVAKMNDVATKGDVPTKGDVAKKSDVATKAPTLTDEQRTLAATMLGLDARTIELDLVKKLLPKTWRIETTGLPDGVVALASGPDGDGRAAVLVSRARDVIDADLLSRRDARAKLAERLGTGLTVTSTRARGLLGGVEVLTEAKRDGAEDLALLHLFTEAPPGYFFTIAAPPARIASLRAQLEAFVAVQRPAGAPGPATTAR